MILKELSDLIKKLKGYKRKAQNIPGGPEGRIRVSAGRLFFIAKDGTSSFIKNKDLKMASLVAQKTYLRKVGEYADRQLRLSEKLKKELENHDISQIYEDYCQERKVLVTPIEISDREYAEKWQAVTYQSMGFENARQVIYTEKGERVRSKSEALIANKLLSMNVPYRYEYPLVVEGKRFLPDFTVLNVRTRQEFILEHFGMMDSEEYRQGFFAKVAGYASVGIVEGANLLMTFEDSMNALDLKIVEQLIRKYLL